MRYGKFFDVGDAGMGQVVIAGETYTAAGELVEEEQPLSIWGKLAEMTKNVVDGLKQKLPEVGSSALTALATSKINERIFGETSPDRVAARPPAIPAAPPAPKAGVPGWVWPVAAVGALGLGFVALKGRKRGKRR